MVWIKPVPKVLSRGPDFPQSFVQILRLEKMKMVGRKEIVLVKTPAVCLLTGFSAFVHTIYGERISVWRLTT